jgi:hypothetical protein
VQSRCAFEQPKEKISSSRTEILAEQTGTGAMDSLQSRNLVPSDCHWAVFLDDIDMDVRFYCFASDINMLLKELEWCWREGRVSARRAIFIKKAFPGPSKPLVTALTPPPIACVPALIGAESYSPDNKFIFTARSFETST